MNTRMHALTQVGTTPFLTPVPRGILQRKCACGTHTMGGGQCAECQKKQVNGKPLQAKLVISEPGDAYELEADSVAEQVMRMSEPEIRKRQNGSGMRPLVQRQATGGTTGLAEAPPLVQEVLNSPGQPLDPATRAFFEPRFGHDFSGVRVHADSKAAKSAVAVNASAYTVGEDIVFSGNQYAPFHQDGRTLLGHELTHVVQQNSHTAQSAMLHRRAAPYIKKISIHLTPPQTADLSWEGAAPDGTAGVDHFTVSTGKGYGDSDDPPGTCSRKCCEDPMKQCAPPWNRPDKVGSCCTYYGKGFWTGVPLEEHNGWKWWTPVQPYYPIRGIALHQHPEVTGQPIGHGCVRMEEANAKRIFDYSNGKRTQVEMDGRAAPVACDKDRRCDGAGAALDAGSSNKQLSMDSMVVPGLEGEMS